MLSLCCAFVLAAEPTSTDIAADLIADRASDMTARGNAAVALRLEQLAAGVRAGRISLSDAQQVLMLAQSLPPAGASSPAPRAPAAHPPSLPPSSIAADQAHGALDGKPATPMPPPIVPSAAVTSPPSPPPPVGPPPVVIGHILAIEPGADGKPALLALATDAKAGVKEGNRLAIRRGDMTLAVARVTSVKPDLTIALLIPGTWHDDTTEIRLDDAVTLLPE